MHCPGEGGHPLAEASRGHKQVAGLMPKGATIVCGGVLGRIFVSRSSYCRPYLERIYLEGQFWRAKICSKTTFKIAIQWPFFSSRTAMNIDMSPSVCSPVHLFKRDMRKTFILR